MAEGFWYQETFTKKNFIMARVSWVSNWEIYKVRMIGLLGKGVPPTLWKTTSLPNLSENGKSCEYILGSRDEDDVIRLRGNTADIVELGEDFSGKVHYRIVRRSFSAPCIKGNSESEERNEITTMLKLCLGLQFF